MRLKKAKEVGDSDESDEVDKLKQAGFEEQGEEQALFNQSKLREYEVQKMRYYYAVVHCNSPQTANYLYDEFNGFEFENTNIRLSMSLIPDDVKFEQPLKDSASEIPAGYQFDFQTLGTTNRAVGHTKVNLTWEKTSKVRLNKLQKGFTQQFENSEDEANYYKDVLHRSSDESDDDNSDDDQAIEQKRKKLLEGLKGEKG